MGYLYVLHRPACACLYSLQRIINIIIHDVPSPPPTQPVLSTTNNRRRIKTKRFSTITFVNAIYVYLIFTWIPRGWVYYVPFAAGYVRISSRPRCHHGVGYGYVMVLYIVTTDGVCIPAEIFSSNTIKILYYMYIFFRLESYSNFTPNAL